MLLFEILAIIVILAFIANGARAGAAETLGRVIGAIIGFLVARTYAGWLIGIVSLLLPIGWAYTVSFLIIFLFVDYIIGLIFKLIENLLKIFTKLPILKQINSLLGGIFGFLEAVVVIGGVTWLLKKSIVETGLHAITNIKAVDFVNQIFEALFLALL